MEIKIDNKLSGLPLTKTNPRTLKALFGNSNVEPFWVADMDFQIAGPIQELLIERITGSGFGYEYKPESFFDSQKNWYRNNYGID